jgi:hypothetical protein
MIIIRGYFKSKTQVKTNNISVYIKQEVSMNRNRILTALITILLLFSLAVPAGAVNYPDLQGHWAKPYMEDMSERGIMNGYADGTMKPGNDITGAETLAMLSRIYVLTDDERARVYDDFGKTVEEKIPSSLSWAYQNMAVCLASGIIRTDELSNLDFSKPIEKEILSVLLVRAMKMTGSLPAAIPTFNDTSEITAAYRPYVRLLYDLGIVTGDDKNYFLPHANVQRAIVATMLSKALTYLESNDAVPELVDYMGLVKTEGIIGVMTGDQIAFTDFNGLKRTYTLSPNTKLHIEGEMGTAVSYAGRRVSVYIKPQTGEVKRVAVSEDDALWVQSQLNRAATATVTKTVYLYDPITGITSSYVLASGVKMFYDGQPVTFTELVGGRFVTLKVEADKVTEIYITSGDLDITASVKSIVFDTISQLYLISPDGATLSFELNIAKLPAILRNGIPVGIDRLRTGDKLTVQIRQCAVAAITLEGQEATTSGVLTAISTTAEGTSLSIRTQAGSDYTYKLDIAAAIWSGKEEIRLADLEIGDELSLVIFGDRISDVYLIKSESSSTKVSGIVLTVDTSKRQIIIKSASSLIYVNVKTTTPIIVASSGSSVGISGLTPQSNVVIYGIYTSSNQFSASSIVIE